MVWQDARNGPVPLSGLQDMIVGSDVTRVEFVQQLGVLRENRLRKSRDLP